MPASRVEVLIMHDVKANAPTSTEVLLGTMLFPVLLNAFGCSILSVATNKRTYVIVVCSS